MIESSLDNFATIQIDKPSDKIIHQIKELIKTGVIKPGERLPSERKLCERLGVGRTHVRDAIRKLEFYDIVKTMPQSGTVVAGLGMSALQGLLTDIVKLEEGDYKSLVEARVTLEVACVRYAALRATPEDIKNLKATCQKYVDMHNAGESSVEEDLLFHITIAEVSKNSVLKSLMMTITPDIIRNFNSRRVCPADRVKLSIEEHNRLIKAIEDKDPDRAQAEMMNHLRDLIEDINT